MTTLKECWLLYLSTFQMHTWIECCIDLSCLISVLVTPLVESLARKYQQYTPTTDPSDEEDEGRLPRNQQATTQKYNTTSIPIKTAYFLHG
jgi:hypothetical protein